MHLSQMVCSSKMVGGVGKLGKIGSLGTQSTLILGIFDLVVFKVAVGSFVRQKRGEI